MEILQIGFAGSPEYDRLSLHSLDITPGSHAPLGGDQAGSFPSSGRIFLPKATVLVTNHPVGGSFPISKTWRQPLTQFGADERAETKPPI